MQERPRSFGATPVHRRSAAALQAKAAARSAQRPSSATQRPSSATKVHPQYAAALDRVIRDPIGLGVAGLRPGSAASITSASKVKGGLGGAIGSAAAAAGPSSAQRLASQARMAERTKYSGGSSMWPPQPPKAAFGSQERSGREEQPEAAEAGQERGGKAGNAAGVSGGTGDGVEVSVVRRSKEQKAHSGERLNMDNQQLTACPRLVEEEKLRLLNYQSNSIRQIQNLDGLPNLIFLDLYNNRIERVEGLQAVGGLRVLMLGKNRLTTIENLEGLGRLDVLDLHSNQIARVEKLTHLSALRVLNLAGNRISRLEGVEGLVSLTELNLRRNVLSSMDALHGLVSLQRMFLSHNQLPSLGAVEPLRAVPQLVELSVEHNPLCTEQVVAGGGGYRLELLANLAASLVKLDSQEVTQAERQAARDAAALAAEAQAEKDAAAKAQAQAQQAREAAPEAREPEPAPPAADAPGTPVAAASAAPAPAHQRGSASKSAAARRESSGGMPRRPSSPGETARVAKIRDVMWEWEVSGRHAKSGRKSEAEDTETSPGFFELTALKLEEGGEEAAQVAEALSSRRNLTQLSIYGRSALSALRDPAHVHVSAVSLQFVSVECMVGINLGAQLAALPELTSVSFAHNHLRSIGELECLLGGFLDQRSAAGARPLAALTVRENQLASLGLYRHLVLRLCDGGSRGARAGSGGGLRLLNGVAVQSHERTAAMAIFPFHAPEHASPAAAFEQPYLGRGYTAPRSTGNSTATYEEAWTAAEKAVASGVTAATAMEAKINALNVLWPRVVREIIATTLHELDDLESWMASALGQLA